LAKLKEYQEKLKKKSKLELLRSMLQSMAITVTAIVAIVVLVPKSPVASIEELLAFTNEIIYHVDVTDVDNAIIPGTLKVVLVNQFEYYEESIDLGKTSGMFSELNPETLYNLKVMADKGFGMENLASDKVTTVTRVGGGIIGSTLISDPVDNLTYDIGLFISDPEAEFQSIQLRYGIMNSYETEVANYVTIPLLVFDTAVTISNIAYNNVKVFLILEGIRWNNEIVELDTFDFTSPFTLYTSMEVVQVDNKQISVSVYTGSELVTDASYEIILKRNKEIIERRQVESDPGEFQQFEITEVFKNLQDEVEYVLELVATFTHPYWFTREIQVVSTQTITTLPDFDYVINVEEFENYYQIDITLTDPFHNFQLAFYTIYQIEVEYEFYYEGSSSGFTPSGDQKSATIFIDKPTLDNYRIEIGVSSEMEYYKYSILSNINPNG